SGTDTQLGPTLDGAHSGDPNADFGVSEYGAGGDQDQDEDVPVEPPNNGTFHPEEYQLAFLESYYQQITARPYLWAETMWDMFDFASDGRVDGELPGRNDKGLISYDRTQYKDAFYFFQANWTTTPVLHLASATYTNRDTNETDVQVFSNPNSVTLTINGISVGTVNSSSVTDDVFQWNNVFLSPGANTVTVTSTQNGQTYTQTAVWNWTPVLGEIPAMTGTPYARIDFEKSNSSTYPGYSLDDGEVYGLQSDGLTYGWNVSNTGNSRDRTGSTMLGTPPDQRYETLVQAEAGGNYSWSIAVPNGVYDVHLVGGEPDYTDSIYQFDLNGDTALSFTPTTSSLWGENIVRVKVTNGQLTVTNGPASSNDKIDYIDINTAAPPAATISAVSPGTRSSPVNSMTITFSEQISGISLSDLMLTVNGGSNVLTGAESLTTTDNGTTWVLGNLADDTSVAGNYTLTLKAAGSGIADDWGNALVSNASSSFQIVAAPLVVSGNNVYLSADAAGKLINAWINSPMPGIGTPAEQLGIGATTSITFNGSAGGDLLTLDFSNGNFAAGLSSGLDFVGSAGNANAIEFVGNGGSLSVTSTGITPSGVFGAAPVELSNVQTIQVAGIDSATFLSSPAAGYTFDAIATNVGLSISGGNVAISSPQTLSNLSVTGTGQLNISNNAITVDFGIGSADPISAIASAIASGYNGGGWDGPGIVSSFVASTVGGSRLYGIGYADGADGIVSQITSGQIEILPTLLGDARLQGNVVFGDFQLLAQYFGSSGGWDEGNFTYRGTIDFGDFQVMAQNFGQSSSALTGPASAAAQSGRQTNSETAAASALATCDAGADRDGAMLAGMGADTILGSSAVEILGG
ncbi:MAG TPA: DUF4982 domain-containing protein, partial [Tepidisphaeraceae bacterium]|nr:DUF4982 domain-containing protein [Tepidisphaeraceae bacterium]